MSPFGMVVCLNFRQIVIANSDRDMQVLVAILNCNTISSIKKTHKIQAKFTFIRKKKKRKTGGKGEEQRVVEGGEVSEAARPVVHFVGIFLTKWIT